MQYTCPGLVLFIFGGGRWVRGGWGGGGLGGGHVRRVIQGFVDNGLDCWCCLTIVDHQVLDVMVSVLRNNFFFYHLALR